MKRSYLLMVAAIAMATAWTGCSKEDNGLDITENVEITAKSKALTLEVDTKAPFEGAISSTNNLTARVLVSTTTADYSTTHANGTMTFAANGGSTAVGFNASGFTGNKAYPGSTQIYMVGLYPAATGTGGWSNFGTTTTHPIDGKSDIMTAAQVNTNKTTGAQTLAFTHKLTKLNVLVVADGTTQADKEATAAAWGKITDLCLTQAMKSESFAKIDTVATVTFSDNAVTFGTPGDSIPFYKAGATAYLDKDTAVANLGEKSIEIPTAATRVAYSLVTPVTLANSQTPQLAYTLSIKTTTATTALSIPVTLTPVSGVTNTAGYAFNVTLTFKGTEIKALATVTAWEAGGEGAGTIE
ncbi:hypothetical protein LJC38_02475 [Parabacteroides sp. OttesenSCG-928-K15]|nr:hypothetical protein [Parabacteroides sp. OttesenSCG-928-K15]